jgi:hypothetical protein
MVWFRTDLTDDGDENARTERSSFRSCPALVRARDRDRVEASVRSRRSPTDEFRGQARSNIQAGRSCTTTINGDT